MNGEARRVTPTLGVRHERRRAHAPARPRANAPQVQYSRARLGCVREVAYVCSRSWRNGALIFRHAIREETALVRPVVHLD